MTDTETPTVILGSSLPIALDGATVIDDLGAPVAGDYGDAAAEYDLLVNDVAMVDRSAGGAVRAIGRDARSFVDSLVSQDLKVLADGDGAHALLLQPQGKLTADFRVLQVGAEALWLDADIGVGSVLAAGLNRFKIRVKAEVDDVTATSGRISVRGPNAVAAVAGALGVDVPDRQHGHGAWRAARVVRADWPNGCGVDVLGPRAAVEAAWSLLTAAGVARAGASAYDALRIEAGLPRQGHELDDATIPQEAFLERDAVSFTKGCFLGQELVCRIDTRGHVNRMLRGVVITGTDLPTVGTEVSAGDKVVGRLTSVGRSPRLGVIGLAMLRREVEPSQTVTLASTTASVRDLPF